MRLYFLRHGIAEDPRPGMKDSERHLTPEGIDEMRRVALGIQKLQLPIDLLLSSPYYRAQETAKIVATTLGLPDAQFRIEERLCPDRFEPEALREIVKVYSPQKGLMFVGHEPTLSGNIAWLCGGAVKMKKAGLACIETQRFAPQEGTLLWLLTPLHLSLIGQSASNAF